MTENLPDPLVPAYVDLRDFQYMELDVGRLRDSRFAAKVDGDAFRAGILLWCAAWHQMPAGSLPDDDIELSNLAGYGRFHKEWRKAREEALYGFVKCSDGRLYHPVIAKKAIAAWESKQRHSYDRLLDRLRKENKRRTENKQPLVGIPTFEQWSTGAFPNGILPEAPKTSAGIPPDAPPDSAGIPTGNSLRGNGTEQNKEKNDDLAGTHTHESAPAREADDAVPPTWEAWRRWFDAEQGIETDPHSLHDRTKFRPLAQGWVNARVSVGQMRAAIAKAKAEATEPIAYLPAYVDRVLANLNAPAKPRAAPVNRQEALEQRNRNVAAEWLAEQGDPA